MQYHYVKHNVYKYYVLPDWIYIYLAFFRFSKKPQKFEEFQYNALYRKRKKEKAYCVTF